MEAAMPNRDSPPPNYPTVEFVLDAIAGWINKYRHAVGVHNELGQCGPDEVKQIAKDLGVSVNELRELSSKGPGSADLLQKMLLALHVDPKKIAVESPGVMPDLQRLCITCGNKKRCQHELAQGSAAEHYHEFCPNAFTLDALFAQKDRAATPH
jgi:hypothetical protein